MDKNSITGAIKMQGYALLLMGPGPLGLKKKLLFQLLNELEIKLSQSELKELEDFYTPPSPISVGLGGNTGPVLAPSTYIQGTPIRITCTRCGMVHGAWKRYCNICGLRLTKEDDLPPGYPPEPSP